MANIAIRETKIFKGFVEAGEKMNGFAVLTHYLRKARPQRTKDLELAGKTAGTIGEEE